MTKLIIQIPCFNEEEALPMFYRQTTDVLKAMETAGENPVKTVVGCGGSQTFLLLINASEQLNLATTINDPQAIKQCVDIANAFIFTGTLPAQKEYITQMPLVDKSNAASYIDPAARY